MPTGEMIRASDRDRERVVAALGDHFAAGRLDLGEFETRVGAAHAATTLGDLAALCTDLPGGAAGGPDNAPSRPAPPPVRRPRPHLGPVPAAWIVTGLICIAIWAATSISRGTVLGFWPVWVIGPWGAALVMRGVSGGGCGRRPHR
jgi:hypothetical protein